MDTMTAYVRSLSDEALADLAATNLVTSQARSVSAEVGRRGYAVAPCADCGSPVLTDQPEYAQFCPNHRF